MLRSVLTGAPTVSARYGCAGRAGAGGGRFLPAAEKFVTLEAVRCWPARRVQEREESA